MRDPTGKQGRPFSCLTTRARDPMPVTNAHVASIFAEMADLLEIQGANPFRVRAYRTAAQTVSGLTRRVADMVEAGEDLSALPGIGDDLAGKIAEIVRSGTLAQLTQLETDVSPELARMLRIPGLGPKRVAALHGALGIDSLDQLAAAAVAGRITEVEGFGDKTQQKIL